MGKVGKLLRRIDLLWVDRVAAVLLTAGAIPDAYSQPHRSIGPVAIVGLGATCGSVAWRRADPVASTLVGITGLIVFEYASRYNGDGSFLVASLALDFYMLGRRRWTLIGLVPFAWLLAGTAAATFVPTTGTVGSMLGAWVLIGPLPFVGGRTLARRRTLADELTAGAAQLLNEQEPGARRARAEERNRMARELHDVIAHCVSVMVVQIGAARRVALTDAGAAREALAVVERAGREALIELRRIVGVLRRDRDEVPEGSPPGLDRLGVLVARAEAAGVPVELTVEGRLAAVPADVGLVAYRLVQEALTNAIKYAGDSQARVCVSVGDDELELWITDTGGGAEPSVAASANGSGHGLIGMAERVKLHGGGSARGAAGPGRVRSQRADPTRAGGDGRGIRDSRGAKRGVPRCRVALALARSGTCVCCPGGARARGDRRATPPRPADAERDRCRRDRARDYMAAPVAVRVRAGRRCAGCRDERVPGRLEVLTRDRGLSDRAGLLGSGLGRAAPGCRRPCAVPRRRRGVAVDRRARRARHVPERRSRSAGRGRPGAGSALTGC